MNSPKYRFMLQCIALITFLFALSSCATLTYKGDDNNLPPILAQDEIIRPYTVLGRITLAVDRYIAHTPDPREWGERALREEAAKMKADAVIFPEISSRPAPHLVIPANEYRAVGVAIRFK